MRDLEQALTAFFEQVASRETALIDSLGRVPDFALTPERWCFTLPALFTFLRRRSHAFDAVSYPEFRRTLYRSRINAAVHKRNAEVVIDANHGHTDRSVYALVWHPEGDRNSPGT